MQGIIQLPGCEQGPSWGSLNVSCLDQELGADDSAHVQELFTCACMEMTVHIPAVDLVEWIWVSGASVSFKHCSSVGSLFLWGKAAGPSGLSL